MDNYRKETPVQAKTTAPNSSGALRASDSLHASGSLHANIVDIASRRIFAANISWQQGYITSIQVLGAQDTALPCLIPGFIDAHVHIESSLLPPTEFARLAVRHGTVGSVSDPHEIANVLGIEGVQWMIANAAATPFHILFGAPSCVPATPFETAGACLDTAAVATLLNTPGIGYLSEVMNFPGVLAGNASLLAMIAAANACNLPVDGHAPGLLGADAARYAHAGISTDHECSTLQEAEDKIQAGMKVLIREGSAARNFDTLHTLISRYPGKVMLCSDDRHPDDLALGHINTLVARAVALGHNLFDVLYAACIEPQLHYGMNLGQLRVGDAMNAALVNNLQDIAVLSTWLQGMLVAEHGRTLLPYMPSQPINRFSAARVKADAFKIPVTVSCTETHHNCRVIVAEDGQLFTRSKIVSMVAAQGCIQPSLADDVLFIAVVNRYQTKPPAIALVRGFGLKIGAIASSVAHDSHNIIAVGCDAESLATAVNCVIEHQGGLAVTDNHLYTRVLPLPIAGLMSNREGDEVARLFSALNLAAHKELGSTLRAPFMTLSFMALLVIPELKLSDKGLFDGTTFTFTDVLCPT